MNVTDEAFSDRSIKFILKVNTESWETMAADDDSDDEGEELQSNVFSDQL